MKYFLSKTRFQHRWSPLAVRSTCLAAILMFIFVAPLFGQQSKTPTAIQRERLDTIAIRDVPEAAPGIATGVVRDGEIVYTKCAGFADLSAKSLITLKTRFNIASNGEQFTALAVILLEEEGKLSLSDDLRKYLPGLYPEVKSAITIEHLLTHTSGIRDVYDLWSLKGITWWKQKFDNGDALSLIRKQEDLNFLPGSQHLYSNSNYIVLTEVVAKASGTSFVEYTNAMFQKLNMPDTSFEADHTKIRGPIAKPYFNFDTCKGYEWIWDAHGDGNIFSTLDDQLVWECIVQGKGETNIDRKLIEKI